MNHSTKILTNFFFTQKHLFIPSYNFFLLFILKAETSETNSRSKRDINVVLRDITHNPVTTWGNQFGEGGACITAKATYGKCTSFKSCYPYFKKIPNLSIFDTWVLGQYDTCTYFTGDGRQAFGVCCTDPPKELNENKPVAIAPVDDSVVVANKEVSSWPPAYITHPPNHAAPTHPPVQGIYISIRFSFMFSKKYTTIFLNICIAYSNQDHGQME